MRSKPELPEEIEDFRDPRWSRDPMRQVERASDAERFIEHVGFAACLTDSRRPGPSLYVAVCGRRDAVMPRNVQKDPEASLTWLLKDEILKRGKVYYAKLARGKAMFIAPRMIPYFHAIWGVRRADEPRRLSRHARAILKVLRKEWEMSTGDLRDESGVKDREAFTKGDGRAPGGDDRGAERGLYRRSSPTSGRSASAGFPTRCARVSRDDRRPRNRALLPGRRRHDDPRRAGPRHRPAAPEAGRGNRALVAEGYATMLAPGWYQLAATPAVAPTSRSGEDQGDEPGAPDLDRDRAEDHG